MTSGEFLKKSRIAAGLSQRELGQRLGFDSGGQAVANWESGRAPFPAKHLSRVAKLLEIRKDDIIEYIVKDYRSSLK